MKTAIHYQRIVKRVSIIFPDRLTDDIKRALLFTDYPDEHVTIEEEYTPEMRGDNSRCYVLADVPLNMLMNHLLKQKEARINSYRLSPLGNDKIRIDFFVDENKIPQYVYINRMAGARLDGSDYYSECVTITRYNADKPEDGYLINLRLMGAIDESTAEVIADSLKYAIVIARESKLLIKQ